MTNFPHDDAGRFKKDRNVDIQPRHPVSGRVSARSPSMLLFVLSPLPRTLPITPAQIDNHIRFVKDFQDLQDLENESARKLYAFVRRTLRAFHLENSYREAYVLNEALLRGVQRIYKGDLIRKSAPWLRSTCWNIVRELSRDQKKTISLEEAIEVEQFDAFSEELEDDQLIMCEAFRLLSEMEQRLLTLKIVEDRSWSDIRVSLNAEGHGDHKEPSLRKKKERALGNLRKRYDALKSS